MFVSVIAIIIARSSLSTYSPMESAISFAVEPSVIQSIWDGKLQDIVFGTIPFHLLMFLLLVMLVLWPEIALWLPAHMGKGP